jgi:uncharacterized RDD family membrane protein YckC
MPKPPRELDLRIEIATPESIAFHYVLAGPFRRLPALLVDIGLRVAVLIMLFLAASSLALVGAGGVGISALLVGWFALSWFYGGLFETLWNGQTPGKRLFGLRVLTVEGRPINALQAVLRNVLRDVDALPLVGPGIPLYMLGLVVMAASDRYQRLGDWACGTMVVVETRRALSGLVPMNDPKAVALARLLPPSYAPDRSLGQALALYVARRGRFMPGRRQAIAATLAAPLRERLGLPADTDADLLLSALYYRKFLVEHPVGRANEARPGTVMEEAALR